MKLDRYGSSHAEKKSDAARERVTRMRITKDKVGLRWCGVKKKYCSNSPYRRNDENCCVCGD